MVGSQCTSGERLCTDFQLVEVSGAISDTCMKAIRVAYAVHVCIWSTWYYEQRHTEAISEYPTKMIRGWMYGTYLQTKTKGREEKHS